MSISIFVMRPERSAERLAKVKAILARGHIARFHNRQYDGEAWKDVNDPTVDAQGDMKAFRKSENMHTLFVAWDSPNYSLEEINS